MKKNILLFVFYLLFIVNWQNTNAQCGAIASPNTTIGCGSSYNMTAQTNAVVYSVVASACSPVSITGTNAFPTACDDCITGQIPLGFNFNFYGNTYNSAVIASNGLVGFGAFTFTGYMPFPIPAGGVPNNYIAGFMCDIDIRNGGTITYATVGTAPNRRFVVYYNNVATYGPGTGRATFQIVLNENGSFHVIFSQLSANWNATTSGVFATSGAENIDGTIAFSVPGRNNTDWPGIASTAQDCYLFNPQPCIFTEWRQGALTVSTNPNYTVSPTVTTTYTAYWNCNGTICSDPVEVTVVTPTLALGTPTNSTSCGSPNGSIPLNFNNVPNGIYTLSYSFNGTPRTTNITVASNTAILSGLAAGTYTAFSIPSLASGCANATANGPVTIGSSNAPTATGVTICQGGAGSLNSSFSCAAISTSIAQNVVFNSGTLATTDPTWIRNGGGTTCNATTGTSYYYDVFAFTVSTAGTYTFAGCFPNLDGHASLYRNAFSGTNPCGTLTNFIIADDDGNSTCLLDPSLTATLSPGITYYIISTTYSALGTGTYNWTFTGPSGATINTNSGSAGTLEWYTAAAGGTAIGTGTAFNPVGVVGSGLANTNTPGTTTYYLACSNTPTCRTPVDFVINASPVVSISGATSICVGGNTTLVLSGASSYTWSGGLGTGVSKILNPSTTTTYTITATNTNGCTATISPTVTVNTFSTAPTITALAPSYCPNTSITLNAGGGTAGTGSDIYWYTGANGTGALLGTGASVNITTTATTSTIYARREGACNTTTDDSETLNIRTFVYAPNGTTAGTYCTDNNGWHHFYNGNEIILSLQGDLSGIPVGFPQVTIWKHGNWYQESQGPYTPSSCANGLTSGEERFEMERSWNVNMGGASLNPPYSVRFYYQPSERIAIETAAANWMNTYPACSYIYKYSNILGFYWFKNISGNYAAPDYDSPLHPSSSNGSTTNGINYVELTGLMNFSGGSGAIILVPDPFLNVKWLYFTGETDNKINYLRWATETEENTAYFNIQRSQDGINFTTIGAVTAQGNSTSAHHYTFNDVNPFNGENYYRLELIETGDKKNYSNTIGLVITSKGLGYNFYPNPTNDIVYYQYETEEKEDLRVEILDVLGKKIANFSVTSNAGMNNIPVDLSALPTGAYMIRIYHTLDSNVHIAKVIKNKF